eukprot:9479690-Pyramimonas_sp.AAC.1
MAFQAPSTASGPSRSTPGRVDVTAVEVDGLVVGAGGERVPSTEAPGGGSQASQGPRRRLSKTQAGPSLRAPEYKKKAGADCLPRLVRRR